MNFINDKIIKYVKSHSCSESELLSELRRETELKCLKPIMLSGEYQGRLLSMISKIKSPENILEIGTYTGYSTLCLAEGLNKNGQIHTIDKNEELVDFQKKYFSRSKFKNNIIQHTGDALKIIPKLNFGFDFIFLDADKENYSKYLKIITPILNKNGLLISDNVLWHGKVLENKKKQDLTTKKIDKFNKELISNINYQTIMISVRDGLSLSIKL